MAEAAEIESAIMRHHRLILDIWFYLVPYGIKSRSSAGILRLYTMNLNVPVEVKIVGRTNQPTDLIRYFPVFNAYQTHLANAPALALGSFKIDGCKRMRHTT